ncbi:TRAP transporter substrate-binding protein DctP [Massilia sp. CCM 8734]|uniref:TRAP transporter substrate-binding protein DctP n=1 Tax=Massilia sp. CCM 8734 TaxID=2609283 RepID=UPI00142370AB|nr:TRAP transporter substrate-binding protein DctP [Massilia sp. CCM 8734]NHZ99603.1 C4-dicarboxylate ABC transporter [Massilia sp. CCM 8734]
MTVMTRRTVLAALASSPLWMHNAWAQTTSLKISHQFPGGTISEGDFRDRLCRMFAAEVEKRSKGALKFSIYPGSSLMKTNSQFSAMRKGALDLSLVPLSYAGGEVPEVNIGLMPGLVTTYEQGYSWKKAEVGKELARILAEKGIVVLSWIWQAGGVASRSKPIIEPEDVRGMKVRGGSREMDLILKAAGAAVVTLPSNEIYAAMQTGAMDAALTSSTSLISFRLEEVSKALTTGRGGAYWFMFEPLMMSKAIFDRLSKEQQALMMAVGGELETFARTSAQADDAAVAAVYQKAGAKVVDLNATIVKKWQAIARTTAWTDYREKNANCAKLLALAEKTL